ncbi:MAG: D-2-hydroxyacid dehydrogenase [Planctomycetaceae bacterium]
MSLVLFPALDVCRLAAVDEAARPLDVVNCHTLDDARQAMPEATAFFGKITPELLAAAPRLRWVQSPTASLEHYLFPELVAHPCQLSNMRGLFSDVIADHVLGLVVCFARNLHLYIRQQVQHRWAPLGGEAARSDFISGPGVENAIDRAHRHLADQTLGIVGCGAIGAEVARRARAFGLTVLAVDPQPRDLPGVIDEVWPLAALPRLLAQSDYVVIAAPHTPQTEKLFRASLFAQMRRTAYLINIGRGAIVDLADLTSALQQGVIAGAGLDVFETEPLPAEHPLWDLPQVILTPHIAGASPAIPRRHLATLLDNIRRFVRGEPPTTLVDKQAWY